MNNIGDLEISLLGFLSEKPLHGYELHKKVTDLKGFGIVWRLKIGKLYAMLNKLQRFNLVSVVNYQEGNRPIRNEFSVTNEGKAVFWDWLKKPVFHGRDFRNYFLLKLYFSLLQNNVTAINLIDIQQKECMNWKNKLKMKESQKGSSENSDDTNDFHKLVIHYRLTQIEADIDWLDWSSQFLSEAK